MVWVMRCLCGKGPGGQFQFFKGYGFVCMDCWRALLEQKKRQDMTQKR